MAKASEVQRQHSLGDLQRLFPKERPFEGARNQKERRLSDPQMGEIDNILFKEFKSTPDIDKEHQSLIPHLLALDRIQKFTKSFLREKANEIVRNGDGVNRVNAKTNAADQESPKKNFGILPIFVRDFVQRKIVMLNRLSVLSFLYELMLKSVRTRTHQEQEEEKKQELLELSNEIAAVQLIITDFQTKLSKSYQSTESIEFELAQLQSKLDIRTDNIQREKMKTNFEMNDDDLQQFCSLPRRVCHALGLQIDFLDEFEFDNMSDEIQSHMSYEDWICNFLRESYKDAVDKLPHATLTEAQILEAIGFPEDGKAYNTILSRAATQHEQQLETHLDLIDRVELFVRDEFKYNVVLSGRSCSRFPYNPSLLNRVFPLGQDVLVAGTSDLLIQPVYVCLAINLENKAEIDSRFVTSLQDDDHVVLFHGTDHESARDIISEGIDISYGKQKRDFSDGAGFYLANNLDYSVDWACSKTSKPAVLVYRVAKELLESFTELSLSSEDKQDEWKEIVSKFRSGKADKTLRKSLREIDFIEGPQACSAKLPPVARPNSYQICVISEDLAEELQNSIHSVLFLDGTIADI